jgi:hypothetical protein
MKDFLLAGHLRDRDCDARVDVADDETYLIAFDQLPCLLHAGADVVGGIFDQKFDRSAQDAALLVDLLDGEFCANHFALRDGCIYARQRIDHSDPHRCLAPGLDEKWRSELRCSKRDACL